MSTTHWDPGDTGPSGWCCRVESLPEDRNGALGDTEAIQLSADNAHRGPAARREATSVSRAVPGATATIVFDAVSNEGRFPPWSRAGRAVRQH